MIIAEEKTFENKIKRYFQSKGSKVWFVKFFANGFTKAGVPDILACINGDFVAIEVKASNGHPSELQLHNLKSIQRANGYAWLLYPNGFDDFKKFVDCLCEKDERGAVSVYLANKGW